MLTQFSSKTTAAGGWLAAMALFAALASTAPEAQRGPAPTDTLGAGPWDVGSGRGRVHVTAIKGLDHPWGIAFLPDAPGATGLNALVTERPGRLRVVRNSVVDAAPLAPAP